jgi:YVTN family beta-propeller protein
MRSRFTLALAASTALSMLAAAAVFAQASAGPKAYIGLFKDNAIGVLDTSTNRLLTTIPIPAGPHGLVVTPDGKTVFASSDGDSKVSVIDTATDSVRASIEVGKSPHGLALTPDGRTVLTAVFGANAVAFIDASSAAVLGTVDVASPHNIAITPDGRTAFVASQPKGAFALVSVDVRGMKRIGVVPLDKMPRALNVSPDGTKLYFTLAGSDAVQVLDIARRAVSVQVPVGASPHNPLFDARMGTALVVSQGPGVLSVIDASADSVKGTVKVGTLPHWIATSPDGRMAYVTNEGSNDLSVVNLDTLSVVTTVPVGNAPRKIVVQPAAQASAGTAGTGQVTTEISGFAFTDTIRVKAGQAVSWTNRDAVPHTVTSDDGLWDSGDIAAGGTWSRRFTVPGTYAYHCGNHPAMTATVIVSAGT